MIIAKVFWFRRGLREFSDRMTTAFQAGYFLEHMEVSSGLFGLRTVVIAVLEKRFEG